MYSKDKTEKKYYYYNSKTKRVKRWSDGTGHTFRNTSHLQRHKGTDIPSSAA